MEAEEIGEAFASVAMENQDEFEDEFNQMMAEADMQDLDELNIGTEKIPDKIPSKPVPQQPVAATADEEEELEAMMAL